MQYRTLGSTGLRVSVVGVGTWQMGGEWAMSFTQGDADAILAAAADCGINLIDTAECYGDHLAERLVGQAIATRGDRGQWVIATKFGHQFHEPFKRTEPRRPDDILQQLDNSLAALRTDYVDLWQYHSWGDGQFFDDDVHAAALRAKDAGKVRHLGNSISSNVNVKQVEASAKMRIEAIQLIYNRLDRNPESTTLPVCKAQNLGVLARVPLASGFLSGKYKPGDSFPDSDVREKWMKQDRDAKLEQVQQIMRDEVPAGTDMAAWALAWCLRDPVVTCVIPGCKSAKQVKSNASAADLLQ